MSFSTGCEKIIGGRLNEQGPGAEEPRHQGTGTRWGKVRGGGKRDTLNTGEGKSVIKKEHVQKKLKKRDRGILVLPWVKDHGTGGDSIAVCLMRGNAEKKSSSKRPSAQVEGRGPLKIESGGDLIN